MLFPSRLRFASPALTLLLAGVSPADAAIWNVNPAGTGDAATIQAAFDLASPGDVIVLAPGTYTDSVTRFVGDGDATAVAHMKAGVDIQSSGGPTVTFIDGQDTHHGLVGQLLGGTEISGITFTQCRTLGNGGGVEKWGGAILVFNSAVLITGNHFKDCVADYGLDGGSGGGGAIFLHGGAVSEIRDNLFLRCYATGIGGAVELFQHGGGTVTNNTFVDNDAELRGGGLLVNASSVTVSNNVFTENTAGIEGGAIACLNAASVSGGCNLFWADQAPASPEIFACGIMVGEDDNAPAPPEFCDPGSEDFHITSGSVADPADPSGCGLRGAFPVACGAISVQSESWGSVKAKYR